MSYLTVATSQNRFAGGSSEDASRISPYCRDFDFGNLLSKWNKKDEFSRESSPPSARLDSSRDNIPWSERGDVMQQMYQKDIYVDTTPSSWYESNNNTNSTNIERNGSPSHASADLKLFAKRKLIQSGGIRSSNNSSTTTWRQSRHDDFTDVSSYSSIDSISDMSQTSVAKNPMNYWTPIGSRTGNSVTPNSRTPRNVSRSLGERGTTSKIVHQIATRQSSEKQATGEIPSASSKFRMTLSANAKKTTSKSVSPKRQDPSNSEDSNAEDDEEVLNDGKMRFVGPDLSVYICPIFKKAA